MITLIEPTQTILPSFNRVLYRISSDNADETGFKYVVKIYNSNDELVATSYYDSPANPADEVEFDVSKLVSTYYSFSNGFYQAATTSSVSSTLFPFYLKCYEYYQIDGEYVIVLASEVVSTTKQGVAASLPLLELKNWVANDYNGTNTSTYKPLTDWELMKCRSTDQHIVGFYNDGKILNLELVVTYSNNTQSTFYLTPSAIVGTKITYFQITPLTYGSTTDHIQLFINWSYLSVARRYEIGTLYIQPCGKYEPMRVAYLNKYGCYDFFNFDLVSKTSFEIEKKLYQKDYAGDIYETDNIVKNIMPVYYTKETQKWKIISDYLTDAQSLLIRQLYSSPLVYLNVVDDTEITPSWIPVKPIATSYELKKSISDKLFNLELDVELGLINNRQSI